MTCGIDGDDEYSINPLPPTFYQSKTEDLRGREIKQLNTSHNFLMVARMILSSFSQNAILAQLIPAPKGPSLKGRQIQQLDSSHSLIHRGISIPIIPTETTTYNLYQKDVIDLTNEAENEVPEECSESEWTLAPKQVFFESHNSEGLSLEQLCERGGMIYDLQTGQYTPCKSWLKKVGHSLEKNLRKGAKKTCKFVKEHKKEILIAAAMVIVGGAVAGAVYYVVGAEIAKDVAGAAIVASASQFKDSPHRRREEDDVPSSPDGLGPDPDRDDLPPTPSAEAPVYVPPLRIPQNATPQDVVDLLTQLPPKLDPNIGLRKIDASPSPVVQPVAPPPQHPTEQQIFNRVFKPAPAPNPDLPIQQLDAYNRHKIEKAASVTPPHVPEVATPIEPAPQTSPIKSPFGAYLDNLYAQTFDPHYVPPVNAIPSPENTAPSTNDSPPNGTENIAGSNTITNIIDSIRQALTMIGEGMSEQELLNPNTPLDPFHHTPQTPTSDSIMDSGSMRSNSSIPGVGPSNRIVENNPSAIASIVDAVQQALTTIGKGLIGQELLNPNTPLDPFNYTPHIPANYSRPLKHISLRDPSKEPPHMPIMLFDAISLPRPPNVGLLPVLCPDGKLDWIVVNADWHKFEFSQKELENGIIHLDAHFKDFMPKIGKEISIVTSQNGINVKPAEFMKDCESDARKILGAQSLRGSPSISLGIGMYNPSQGLIRDLGRVGNEQKHKETSIVQSTRYLMTAIAKEAHKINSDFLWLDLRHSEAGLIFCRAFEGMDEEIQKIINNNLLSVALGPAEPISNKMAKEAVNFYSEKDRITKRFAKPFLNDPNYDIRIIACISPWGEFSMYIADHARAGTTYDTALKKMIDDLNERYGFYKGEDRE